MEPQLPVASLSQCYSISSIRNYVPTHRLGQWRSIRFATNAVLMSIKSASLALL